MCLGLSGDSPIAPVCPSVFSVHAYDFHDTSSLVADIDDPLVSREAHLDLWNL